MYVTIVLRPHPDKQHASAHWQKAVDVALQTLREQSYLYIPTDELNRRLLSSPYKDCDDSPQCVKHVLDELDDVHFVLSLAVWKYASSSSRLKHVQVTLLLPDAEELSTTSSLEGSDIPTATRKAVLEALALYESRALGMLEISSAPAGALLSIDGLQKGQTPLSLSLPMGKHELVLSHPHKPAYKTPQQAALQSPRVLKIHYGTATAASNQTVAPTKTPQWTQVMVVPTPAIARKDVLEVLRIASRRPTSALRVRRTLIAPTPKGRCKLLSKTIRVLR